MRVELIDGSYHDGDSSEMAFKIAGSMAFKEAVKRANPILLEPVMRVGGDWRRLPAGLNRPFLLAGGLHPDNVFDAIVATMPWGVDVSSGIESEPGIKDGERMHRFVAEVRRADCHVD